MLCSSPPLCCALSLNGIRLCATPRAKSCQAPLSMGILQAGMLEWVAIHQGIFPTQGLNPGLPHCRRILHHLSQQGSPGTLEWVAIPSPGDLPDPGIELGSPALQVDSLPFELPGKSPLTCRQYVPRTPVNA